jgi:two-component system sensor histidine kinase/response regulator
MNNQPEDENSFNANKSVDTNQPLPRKTVPTGKAIALEHLQTQSAIIVTDRERRITWVNDSFTDLTGYTLEEVKGKKPSLLQGLESDRQSIERMRQHLNRGERFVEQILNYKKNGTSYWAQIEACPLFSSDDARLEGFFVIHSDVSKLKKDYLSLQNFRSAVEKSPSVIVITNLGGVIRYVNPAFEKITGYSADEAIGQHTRLLKSGLQDADYYKQMWGALKKQKHWEGVFQNRRKDATIYWEYASISEIKDENESPIGYIAIKQDITQQKEAEFELARLNRELDQASRFADAMATKAQNANQAKTSYLAEMSHEIRTPMNGILGLSELLLDTALDEDQRKFIEIIHSSGESLLQLINNILDLSKIEAGRVELAEEAFSLSGLLDDVLNALHANARKKDLDLVLQKGGDVPDVIFGDRRCLRQIMLNLLGNAIKFTDAGDVRLSVDVNAGSESASELLFSIRDSGVGITPEDQQKLFVKYSQAGRTSQQLSGGTGLGLVISKELVERMQGSIGVRSPLKQDCVPPTPGAGTEFWVKLPLRLSASSQNDSAQNPQTPTSNGNGVDTHSARIKAERAKKKLLLAEDNPTNRMVAELMLKKMGYSVRAVENGQQAVEWACAECFDLVLMDIQMPVMDGFEASLAIRNANDFATPVNVPIVATTARAMITDRDKCFEVGMNAFLAKPISIDQLATTLEELLHKNTAAD